MPHRSLPSIAWGQVSAFVAESIGLHFPEPRWPDLERGLAAAAAESGLSTHDFAHRAASHRLTKKQLQALVGHLTIGETYFFRDKAVFDALADRILPEIVASRRPGPRRLRLWSAACCTGEEAYSLAIALQQGVPDLATWDASILATDLNSRFLETAIKGVYGEWSFRSAPSGLKKRCFRSAAPHRYEILPEIKQRVHFAQLNLIEEPFPFPGWEAESFDIIFCRNVLMYFTPEQTQNVVRRLYDVLSDGGWLVVSPSEASRALFRQFTPVNFPGVTVFRKESAKRRKAEAPVEHLPLPFWPATLELSASKTPTSPADSASKAPRASKAIRPTDKPSAKARALADAGQLEDALQCCAQWIAEEKLSPSAHYLQGVILQGLGRLDEARRSLQRAVYVDPDFVIGHFALGTLARDAGRAAAAEKQFRHAERLLRRLPPDELLPESEGLTAGRLLEIIESIAAPAHHR